MIHNLDITPYLNPGKLDLGDASDTLKNAISHLDERINKRPVVAGRDKIAVAAGSLLDFSAKELREFRDPLPDLSSLARLMSALRHISQTYSLLEVADEQRKGNLTPADSELLDSLDALIQSAYEPVQAVAGSQLTFQPKDIVGIFFEDNFLARPQRPVPYVIIPGFLSRSPWSWNGVVHEVGHHIYQQCGFLRHELDVIVARALAIANPPLSYEVQRLWFGWLQESFCDIYGVLLLGEAYMSSQFALYLYDRLPIREALGSDPTHAPTPMEQEAIELALQRNLLRDPSGRHPAPAIRGLMAVTVLEVLRQRPADPGSLAHHWQTQIVKTLRDNQLGVEDPHGTTTTQGPAELSFDEVEQGMRVMVNTILHKRLCSFGCNKTLRELVAFDEDELLRETLLKLLEDQTLHLGDGRKEVEPNLAVLPSIISAGVQLPDPRSMRCWIAAQHMYWRATTRLGTP